MDRHESAQKELPSAQGDSVRINLGPIPTPVRHHKSFNFMKPILNELAWIPPKLDLASLKPVIRSSVSAWVCLILLIVPQTEAAIGQASFLILIAALLSPPNEPFIAIIQRELTILFFACLAWAWSALGIKLASLGRSQIIYNPSGADVFSGKFVERTPSIVLSLFLASGAFFFLYIKVRLGVGPYIFATIFGCITVDICLTNAALFPYPYYMLGRTVIVPLAIHSAVSIACSVLIFPETINAQFTKRLRAVFVPLAQAIRTQPPLLEKSPLSPEFDPSGFRTLVSQAEAALLPLRASGQSLKRDFSFGRLSVSDLKDLQDFARKLAVRSDGLSLFYRTIDPFREHFPGTLGPSHPGTAPASVLSTPTISRAQTLDPHEPSEFVPGMPEPYHSTERRSSMQPPVQAPESSSRPSSRHRHRPHQHHLMHYLRTHNINLVHERLIHSSEHGVGLFETQRYMNIEAHLSVPQGAMYIQRAVSHLRDSSAELLMACTNSLDYVVDWLERSNTERFSWRKLDRKANAPTDTLGEIKECLDRFKRSDRMRVLKPYVSEDGTLLGDAPPHRYLFQCFVYQFHLLIFAELIVALLEKISVLDKERTRRRVWMPTIPWKTFLLLSFESKQEYEGNGPDDENPEEFVGVTESPPGDERPLFLSDTRGRDPDALPPTSALELLGTWIFFGITSLGRGNLLYALKAGILTVLISLPSYMRSSASLAYREKWVWAIFMAQLTLSRFRGDTSLSFISRLISSFIGGIAGMVVWYISTGSGRGNAYGLAATCAVFFPCLVFFRIYYPGPPITTLITSVTIVLIIGYSWQDTHRPTAANPGFGFKVSWRRFVLVGIGVTSAFLFSFLPPATSIRRYHRLSQATSITELGNILCSIISLTAAREKEREPELVVKDLILIRSKLRRSKAQSMSAKYEVSLRGKWPGARYAALSDLQTEIAHLLSHIYTVAVHFDGTWNQVFLHRTRLLDPDFLGSVMSIIFMCSSSLQNGTPMPQITSAPLMDRFLFSESPGLNTIPAQREIDYGLPKTVTPEVLADEQYMCFSVGVASVYGIIMRLDRLTLAVKELVGEGFHVDGVEIPFPR